MLHGNPRIHGYISSSLRDYPDVTAIGAVFASHGFREEISRPLFGGMMRLHLLQLRP